MATLKEVGGKGAAIGMLVFTGFVVILIMRSDSPSVAVERFGRFTYALAMTIAPTNKLAVFIDIVATLVGLVSASRFKESILAAIVTFVAVYTFLALSINYLMAPI